MKPTVAISNSRLEQPAARARAIKTGLVWGAITLAAVVSVPKYALADEGGVSFWLPGFFGSLAATPQQPGWSLANIDYYTNVSAGAGVALAKSSRSEICPLTFRHKSMPTCMPRGYLPLSSRPMCSQRRCWAVSCRSARWKAMAASNTSLYGTVSGTVTGPLGNTMPFGPRFDAINSSVTGFTDFIPLAQLKWNSWRQQLHGLRYGRRADRSL